MKKVFTILAIFSTVFLSSCFNGSRATDKMKKICFSDEYHFRAKQYFLSKATIPERSLFYGSVLETDFNVLYPESTERRVLCKYSFTLKDGTIKYVYADIQLPRKGTKSYKNGVFFSSYNLMGLELVRQSINYNKR